MPKPYDATTRTIGDLLADQGRTLLVPLYQRAFSWKTNEIKEFWEDIKDFAEEARPRREEDQYFLGSIVLVERESHFDVLDGQQRLATATILLAVIRDLMVAESDEWTDQAKQLQEFIVSKRFGGPEMPRLTLSRQDRAFFQQKVQTSDGERVRVPPRARESIKLLNSGFQLLHREAAAYREAGNGVESLERLAIVLLHNVSLVVCTSTSYDTAAGVFETLNDRGIELSTADLLRTWLLGEAASDDERETIASAWDTVFSIQGDAKVDDFIRHYWLSHHGDVKKRKLYREIREWVTANKRKPVKFSLELADAAEVYQELAGARDENPNLRRGLEAVRALGAKALMPSLLSLWQSVDKSKSKERDRLLRALVVLYVRHILIGGRDNSELEQMVFGIAKDLRRHLTITSAIQRIHGIMPTDEAFKSDFAHATISRRGSAAYVLRSLEHEKRPTRELKVETPDLVHVDHIYPQKPAGKRWNDHDEMINRIGNLTPLAAPFNQSLKNARFSKKKPKYKASDLLITRDLAVYQTWTRKTISERQAELAKLAVKAWPYPA